MLNKDVKTRIAPENIKAHKFFKTINFYKLVRKEVKPPFIPERSDINPLINVSSSFLDDKIKNTGSSSIKMKSLHLDNFTILPGDSVEEGSLPNILKH